MTCGSMKQSATNFFNDTNFMDIRIVSSLGISQENADTFKNVDGVEAAMPSRETDVLTNFGNEQYAVRLHSLPNSLDINEKNYINQVTLKSGDWPKNADECVLSADAVLASPTQIGDYFDVLECSTGMDSTLNVKRLKVVGFVTSSYYMSNVMMGSSTLGKGTVNQFAYVGDSTFKESFPYSEVFLTVSGTENFVTGTPEYQAYIDIVMNRLAEVAPGEAEIRSAAIKDDAQQQLDDAKREILEQERMLNEKYDEFNSTKKSVMGQLNSGIVTAENTKAQASSIKAQGISNQSNLNHDNSLVVTDVTGALKGLPALTSDLITSLSINNDLYNLADDETARSAIDKINFATNLFKEYSNQFYLEIQKNDSAYAEYIEDYKESYEIAYSALSGRTEICEGIISTCQGVLDDLYSKRSSAIAEFDSNEKQLIDGKAKIDAAKEELGISQDAVNDLEAKFFIMDRTKNFGAINFNNDAERIASIANVFPLMFFFVALLVALTSMTRMIEEERIAIGTYKALGFSKIKIANKYILYGVIASLIGSVVGLAVLCNFLPFVIMFAYSIIYICPIPLPMPFDFMIGIASTLVGIGLTVVATLMAAAKSLRLVPAQLMIPSAPKVGKRILLEYVKPVWKVLSFNWKITFRNMFLYKKRLFMTLIGIAGCTALLLTGFGLHDSISDIMIKQFDEIANDNFKVIFVGEVNDRQEEIAKTCINQNDEAAHSTLIHEENFVAMPEGSPNANTSLIVPKNIDQFQDMRVMRNRTSGESFTLDDSGVYVSEKLANLMKLQAGDTLTIYNQDLIGNAGEDEYNLKIAGVVENFIAHYVYMSPNVYKKYFGKDPVYNSMVAQSFATGNQKQILIDNMKSNDFVKTAYFTTATRDTFDKMLQSVNLVVVVLIVSAGLLAFVVLYNLININICERAREVATLKVLGSNKHEINLYINRETFLLSLLGALAGIVLGIFLEQFVIMSAEVDYVMFGRNIYWWSYVISLGVTIVFTLLVSLFMRKKIFSISMVESLKSVE